MLGEIFNSWDYEKRRFFLLIQSAGFKIIRERLLLRYPVLSEKDETASIKFDLLVASNNREITALISKLHVSYLPLKNALRFGQQFAVDVPPEELIYYRISEDTPLILGNYIRIDPHTNITTVKKTFTLIKDLYGIRNELNKNQKSRKEFVRKKDRPPSFKAVKHFFNVEENMHETYTNLKVKKFKIQSIVAGAIATTAEKFYPSNDEQGYATVQDNYYTVQRYYNLPTMTVFDGLLESIFTQAK